MTTPTTTTAPAAAPGTPTGRPRLRNGELRRMVAQHLTDNPASSYTPGELARAMRRSSGAVGNALAALTHRGQADQVGTNPSRYTANTATATAAVAVAATGTSGATTAPGSARTRRPTPRKSAAAATTTGTGAVSGPVARPNGQMYHPRKLSGLPDVTALRKLRDAGVPALLYGPPGTGKTSVAEAAFGDLITVPGDGDTTVADFVGEYTQTPDGRYVFVHGPLVTAMREGRPLFIDDATLIPPSVLAVVYPAMDGRRQIVVKANGGEVVTAADGFYVLGGHNPGVHGAVLTDALSSRFSAQIHVTTDYDLATQLKIDKRAVRIARNLSTRQGKGEIGWAPQLRELLAFARIADVLGADAAVANLVGVAPEEDRETVAAVVRDVFGAPVQPLALGGRI